jgi:hypothetical protein
MAEIAAAQVADGNTQVAAGSPPSPPPPPQAPAAQPPPPPAGAAPAPGAPQAPQAPGESASIRELLSRHGLGGEYQSDREAAEALVARYREAGHLAQYGQEYLRHAGEFQAYLAEKQKAALEAKQSERKKWFQPPEYDRRWNEHIRRNPETGRLEAVEGAPPDVVQKYTAWAQHQRDFLDRLAQDPIEAIRPGLELTVEEKVQKLLDERLGQMRAEQEAQAVLARNRDWLTRPDPQTGREALTAEGQRFSQYVGYLGSVGVTDVRAQEEIAKALLAGDLSALRLQQQQAPGGTPPGAPPAAAPHPGADGRAAFLSRAAAGTNGPAFGQGQVPPPADANGVAPPRSPAGPRALADRLTRALAANGYGRGETLIK